MQFLKANTAATILIGPFVDKGDGVTPEEGVTLAGADSAELMKHDGTTFVDLTSDSRTFTHKEKGMYTLALGTGDTDTEGRLTVFISDESVCLPVWKDFMVLAEAAYDSMFAAKDTGYMDTNVKAIEDADPTDTLESAVDAGLDNAIGASPTADSVAQRVKAIDLLTEASGGGDLAAILADVTGINGDAMRGTDSAALASAWTAALATALGNYTAARAGYLDELAAANIPADIDAILTDTGTTLDGIVDSILADTNELQTDLVNGGRLDLLIDAILADTAALNDTALSELSQAAPSATPTLKAAIMLIYMALRNKLTVTSTEMGIHNDAGTKIAKKALSEDGTTYTESEMASGA